MTPAEARALAEAIKAELPKKLQPRLRAIHIMPHLHEGHLTIRVFTLPRAADDPEPFIFTAEEL